MNKLICLPLLLIMLFGCVEEDSGDSSNTLSFRYEEQSLNIDNIVKVKSIAPLETNDSILIGSVYKMILNEDKYWLLDTKRSTVNCFNIRGKFIYRIENRGKGPEEYFTISDISFSPEGDHLIVYDAFSKKMLYYTIGAGVFDKVTNLKIEGTTPQSIHPLSDSTFLGGLANVGSNNIITFNTKGEVLDDYLAVPELWKNIYFLETFREFDGKILYPYPMDGRIYEFEDNDWKIRYTIDLGQEEMYELIKLEGTGNLYERTTEFEQEISDEGYILAPVDIRETKDFVLIQAKYKSQLIWGIHDKTTKTSLLPGRVVTNNIPQGLVERFPFATRGDSTFVTIAYPSQLLKNSDHLDIRSDKYSQLSDLSKYDNPVIVEYSLVSF